MLLRFRVSNFRSIRTQQEFSLIASTHLKDHEESVLRLTDNTSVLRCAAIYGANASGKTNVLKAFSYMMRAVEHSQRQWAPQEKISRDPFKLDEDKPSIFEADIFLRGVRYQYGFILNSERFTDEWLYAFPNNRKQQWFIRREQEFSFGKAFTGPKGVIASLTRHNSLFLSAAAQNNHEGLVPLYRWFADSVYVFQRQRTGLVERTAEYIENHPAIKPRLLEHLCSADLGVCDFAIQRKPLTDSVKEVVQFIRKTVTPESSERDLPETLPEVSLSHRTKDALGNFALTMDEESDGTQAYFGLLGPITSALDDGDTLLVDELDSSLHPLLALKIVRIFNDPKLNPRGAQLIFNTHDTNLLDNSILRRDQIWFTEKGSDGSTHLYPLTDFKPRKHENFERGYLQGRYGAIPFVEPVEITSTAAEANAER